MIVVEKNEGTKIEYDVSKAKITFADELMLNLTKLEKDWPVHRDICMDADGNLTTGVGDGLYYVAEIDIPAREYTEAASEEEQPAAKPLDMGRVTLTLWGLENPTPSEEEEE